MRSAPRTSSASATAMSSGCRIRRSVDFGSCIGSEDETSERALRLRNRSAESRIPRGDVRLLLDLGGDRRRLCAAGQRGAGAANGDDQRIDLLRQKSASEPLARQTEALGSLGRRARRAEKKIPRAEQHSEIVIRERLVFGVMNAVISRTDEEPADRAVAPVEIGV